MRAPRTLVTLSLVAGLLTACSTTSVETLQPSHSPTGEPLIVAMDAATPPLAYAVSDSELQGMEVEMMNAVAARLDRPLVIRPMPFAQLIDAVADREVDAAASGIFDTSERRTRVDFVDYSMGGSQWLVPADSTASPDAACGLRVGAVRGSQQLTRDLPARSQECTDAGEDPLVVVEVASNDLAPQALLSGEMDAFVSDSPISRYLASRSKGRLRPAGSEYDVQVYGIAVPKDSEATSDIRSAIEQLTADGTIDRLMSKWGIDK